MFSSQHKVLLDSTSLDSEVSGLWGPYTKQAALQDPPTLELQPPQACWDSSRHPHAASSRCFLKRRDHAGNSQMNPRTGVGGEGRICWVTRGTRAQGHFQSPPGPPCARPRCGTSVTAGGSRPARSCTPAVAFSLQDSCWLKHLTSLLCGDTNKVRGMVTGGGNQQSFSTHPLPSPSPPNSTSVTRRLFFRLVPDTAMSHDSIQPKELA